MTFYEILRASQTENNSWLCVGLDPLTDPASGDSDAGSLLDFCCAVVDQTVDLACAYKPNLAHWLRFGGEGIDALGVLVRYIPETIPVILDAKFGDIDATAGHYRQFAFETLGAQAVTLNPYIGTDSIRPFLSDSARGVFVLSRTSNVTGNEFQAVGMPPLYEQVARQMVALSANHPGQIGLVVGATQPDELRAVRTIAPNLPFLIPGIGAQGGQLDAAIQYGGTAEEIGPVITVGRAILYGAKTESVRERAQGYRDQINNLRTAHND
jgi:orotidine-5'-phosphate decarboxylase